MACHGDSFIFFFYTKSSFLLPGRYNFKPREGISNDYVVQHHYLFLTLFISNHNYSDSIS
jgi:hypothetical protein